MPDSAQRDLLAQIDQRTALPSDEQAHARRDDPDTSHDAARSVRNMTAKQEAVYRLFLRHGPLCDEDVRVLYRRARIEDAANFPLQSDSGMRTRRCELVRKHKLQDSGARRVPYGKTRRQIVWELT